MAEESSAGSYWDLDECAWVRSPAVDRVAIPAQADGDEADDVAVAPV